MPPSQDRDAAIGGFVTRLAWEDPLSAIGWANEITDQSLQEKALVNAGRAYRQREPEAAEAWMETAPISANAKQQILKASQR